MVMSPHRSASSSKQIALKMHHTPWHTQRREQHVKYPFAAPLRVWTTIPSLTPICDENRSTEVRTHDLQSYLFVVERGATTRERETNLACPRSRALPLLSVVGVGALRLRCRTRAPNLRVIAFTTQHTAVTSKPTVLSRTPCSSPSSRGSGIPNLFGVISSGAASVTSSGGIRHLIDEPLGTHQAASVSSSTSHWAPIRRHPSSHRRATGHRRTCPRGRGCTAHPSRSSASSRDST